MKRRRCALGQQLVIALLGTAALLTHLADGYAWCQEYWNWDGKRHSSTDGRRWPANDGVVITYINGIFHSVPDWESITHQLQTIFGHEVRPFYNPSSGWWITDASKAGYHLLRKPANDTIAHALGEHLAQAVEDVGRGRVLHIAHSGGALITYLAAQHHLTKRQRDKIDVLTFGGARSITRKYFSGRVVNYYARNDPLVKLDRRAAELMKLTNNTKFQEVNEKHNTTFVFLEGRAKQFVLDHSLEGPTYQHALRKEARAFRRAHFGPLSPLSWDYDQSVFRLARKKMAQLSGLHHFFNTDPLGLRLLRKGIARLTGLHGFFSGKSKSRGGAGGALVPVAVGNKEVAVSEGDSASEGSRWWWWPVPRASGNKSGQEADAITPPPVVQETPADGSGSDGRFWIGFRWTRRGSDKEDQGESAGVGGSSDGITADQNLKGEPPLSSVVVAPKSRSLFTRVRRSFWGLGRGSGTDADAEVENVDIIDVPESEESEDDTVEGDAKTGATEARRNSRPWLFSGWTPWGKRAESTPDDEPFSATAISENVAEGEAQEELQSAEAEKARSSDGGGDGEGGDGGATHLVGSAGVSDEATGPPSVSWEDLSSIRRWWFGSSGTKANGNASLTKEAAGESGRDSGSKAAGGEGLEDGGEGEEKGGGGDPEGRAGGESEGDPLGQTGENDEGQAGDATLTATSETNAEASTLPSDLADGEKGEEEEEGNADTSTSMSLLRRWWPLPTAESSDGRGVEPVLAEETGDSGEQQQQQQEGTEEATSIPPAVLPSVIASAEQQQQPKPEDVDVVAPPDGAQDNQSPPPPPSLLQRWWPTSKLQRLEEPTTSPLDSANDAQGHKVITGTATLVEEAEDALAEADAPNADVPGVDGLPGLGDCQEARETTSEEKRGIGHELPRAAVEETLPESAPEHPGQREDGREDKEEEIADVATSGASGPDSSPTAAAATSAVDDEGASSGQATTLRPPLVSRFWDVFTNRATEPEEVSPPPPVDDAASCEDGDDKHGKSSSPVAPAEDVGNNVEFADAATQGNSGGVPVDTEQAKGAGEAGIWDSGEVFVSEGFLKVGEAERNVEGERVSLPLSPPVDSEESSPLGGGGDKEAGKSMDEEESRGGGREIGESEGVWEDGAKRRDHRDADGDAEEEGEMEEDVWTGEEILDDEASENEAMIHAARRAERGDGGSYEKEEETGEGWEGREGLESDGAGAGGGREGLEKQENTAPRGGTGATKEWRVMNDNDSAEARR